MAVQSDCSADIDGDGAVSISDVLGLLSVFWPTLLRHFNDRLILSKV